MCTFHGCSDLEILKPGLEFFVVPLFLSSFCGLAAHIVLLGNCYLLVVWGGVLGLVCVKRNPRECQTQGFLSRILRCSKLINVIHDKGQSDVC